MNCATATIASTAFGSTRKVGRETRGAAAADIGVGPEPDSTPTGGPGRAGSFERRFCRGHARALAAAHDMRTTHRGLAGPRTPVALHRPPASIPTAAHCGCQLL